METSTESATPTPTSLRAFEMAIADPEQAAILLHRLRELPRNRLATPLQFFEDAYRRLKTLETELATVRQMAKVYAKSVWTAAKNDYTTEQLQIATGCHGE